MEQLQKLLIAYNQTIPEEWRYSWSKQYLTASFPCYWRFVYSTLSTLDKSLRVLEIGAGQGDVTAISCYLGFKSVIAYEREFKDAKIAQEKIISLFGKDNIIINTDYPHGSEDADVMIMVNCSYADECLNKEDYLQRLLYFYTSAGCPKTVLLEVIDSSYSVPDNDFPIWIRLSKKDIEDLFPNAEISVFETYRYPINKRTKNLYIIKHPNEYCSCN